MGNLVFIDIKKTIKVCVHNLLNFLMSPTTAARRWRTRLRINHPSKNKVIKFCQEVIEVITFQNWIFIASGRVDEFQEVEWATITFVAAAFYKKIQIQIIRVKNL